MNFSVKYCLWALLSLATRLITRFIKWINLLLCPIITSNVITKYRGLKTRTAYVQKCYFEKNVFKSLITAKNSEHRA